MEVSDTSKIVGPSPLRSQLIRNHDRKNECFLTTFWEKMVCFTKLTPRTPPSVIHGWKATDLLYEMVRRKNYWRNPISRQNFANALAVNHNLKLEVCLIKHCHIVVQIIILKKSILYRIAKAKEDNNRVVSRGKKAELAEKRRHNLREATATWHDHEDGSYYPYFVKLKAAYFVKP